MSDVISILLGFVAISGFYAIGSYFVTKRYLDNTVDGVADIFGDILEKPTVKKAFSILGGKSAEGRADRAVVDDLATDMLNSPQLSTLKMGADLIGIDMEAYVEKHGALGTIQGLTQIAGLLGIDINQLLAGGLQGTGGTGAQGGANPYF